MTNRSNKELRQYIHAQEFFEDGVFSEDPGWARNLRQSAMANLKQIGLPTQRRGNEEWKYTDVRPIARTDFQLGTNGPSSEISESDLAPLSFGGINWIRLVFINGTYSPDMSSLSGAGKDITVTNLSEGMKTQPDLVRNHLSHYADYETKAFTALNTSFVHDGALVHIPDNQVVTEPIQILFLSAPQYHTSVSHPRVLVVTGKHSEATIIEGYTGPPATGYLTNGVTELVIGEGSSVKYYKAQRQGQDSYHITTTEVILGRDSNFSSVNIDLGGKITRNNLNILTQEENSSCKLSGLYMVTGTQHVDNQVIIDHAKPYTTSRELYKGVLAGSSRSVFHGSIIVREGAVKVNAHQVDKNLLLSDKAEADTKPAFWVYCDDVLCGHGAACGQMDESALFYLRSRGLDEQAARGMLTRAFVNEVIDNIENKQFRDYVDELVENTLEDWLNE